MDYKIFQLDDINYKTTLTKKFENRQKWVQPDERKITAYIPGTIREVFVQLNQEVKKGDSLLILEAMKMKNKVLAPKNGKIISINFKEGQIVKKDEILIEMD